MNKMVIILFGILSILSYSSEAQIIKCCEIVIIKTQK